MAATRKYRLPTVMGIGQPLPGGLLPGSLLVNGVPSVSVISLAGLQWFRVYFLSTAGGSLKIEFLRAGGIDTVHVISTPAPTTITANTEAKIDINPHFGEHAARVTFTPSADGVVTWAEYDGVAPAKR